MMPIKILLDAGGIWLVNNLAASTVADWCPSTQIVAILTILDGRVGQE